MPRLFIFSLPLLLVTVASADTITIDNFESGSVAVADTLGGGPMTGTSSGPTTDILGGTRDISVEVLTGPSATVSTFEVGLFSGEGTLINGPFAATNVELTYAAGGPHDLLIDAGGLTGVSSSTFVTFDFIQALGLSITATATDSDGDIASTTVSGVTGGITPTELFVDWTPDGGNSGAVDYDSVSSLVFSIVAVDGSDWRLNNISVGTTLPEPTSGFLTGLLLLGVVYRRRKNT